MDLLSIFEKRRLHFLVAASIPSALVLRDPVYRQQVFLALNKTLYRGSFVLL